MPRKRKRSSWGSEPELVRPGVYRIRYTADTGDGRGKTRRSETVYGTRRQADQRRNELRLLYERQAGKPATPTVGEAWGRCCLLYTSASFMVIIRSTRGLMVVQSVQVGFIPASFLPSGTPLPPSTRAPRGLYSSEEPFSSLSKTSPKIRSTTSPALVEASKAPSFA